jgi:hypothetical protein
LASSALRFASNSSLLLYIAKFMAFVLDGFSTTLSVEAYEAYLAKLFYNAALNLSTGA